jgi:acetylglutamate kinase
MRTLIKLGGTLLDSAGSRTRLAQEIAGFAELPENETVVVHGGGKQMTRFLSERGIESRFINGLRVSTPEVIDAVLKVFAGSVNHELVASLVAAGAKAVGLSGIDASLVEAVPLGGEYGAVGMPVRSNPEVLHVLCKAGFLPVVASIGGDRAGNVYNVNADQMAVTCAIAFGAEQIFFLTDVDGVRDGWGNIVESLDIPQVNALIQDGIAAGGMQAKLEAAQSALTGGVRKVVIAPGGLAGVVDKLRRNEAIGTNICKVIPYKP